MKIKLTLFSTFFIMTVVCLVIIGYKLYNKYESLCDKYRAELNFTFHQAVLSETQKRLVEYKIPFVRRNNLDKKRSEHASITSASGTIYIKRTEEYESLSLEEKDDLFLQNFLADYGVPLNVNWLNNIWVEKLKEKQIIDLETGVKYRHRDFADTIYSDRDSLFFVNSSRIDWYVTGIFKEIDLQGHYVFSYTSLYHYAKKDFIIFILLGGILILNLIVCSIMIVRETRLKEKEAIPSAEEEYILVLD